MGGQRRFVKKIPPSGAAPIFKLNLPHQVVHQHLAHLVDNDLELAGSPDAEQTWHATVAPRRNKDRSEYTLQGWRLFAEANKIQAGDQVAFELVTETRLVAQIIKHANDTQPTPVLKAKVSKRKAGTGPCASDSVFQPSAGAGDHLKALDDTPLPIEDGWDISPQALLSAVGTCNSPGTRSCIVPQPCKAESQELLNWESEDRVTDPSMGMELDYHNTRHSLGSTYGRYSYTRLSMAPWAMPELSFSSCMISPTASQSPLAYASQSDLMDNSLHDVIMGGDEPFVLDDMFGGGASITQPTVAPLGEGNTSTLTPDHDQSPVIEQTDEQTDNDFPLMQSLQRQAQAALIEAEAARQRCERLHSSLQDLQSSLRSHSGKALKAAVCLEACSANLSYTHNVPADMASWLGQLKDSLSHLLVMAIDDDRLVANPTPASLSSGSKTTSQSKFAMPF